MSNSVVILSVCLSLLYVSYKKMSICKYYLFIAEFLCYDYGCHLKKYAINPCRKDVANSYSYCIVNIVVDKLHMKGHTDSWCKKNCDAKSYRELDNVRACYIAYVN